MDFQSVEYHTESTTFAVESQHCSTFCRWLQIPGLPVSPIPYRYHNVYVESQHCQVTCHWVQTLCFTVYSITGEQRLFFFFVKSAWHWLLVSDSKTPWLHVSQSHGPAITSSSSFLNVKLRYSVLGPFWPLLTANAFHKWKILAPLFADSTLSNDRTQDELHRTSATQ